MKKLESSDKITILALSWRDIKAPKAGGAEIHEHRLISGTDMSKFRVIHFSMSAKGLPEEEVIDGVTYLRAGGALGVIFAAAKFYHANKENIDFVIDQCNTHRFFTRFWVPAKKRIFYIHQLTREIWDYMAKPPISWGKYFETAFLRLQRKDYCITVSDSTKADLVAVGFNPDKIMVVPEWITTKPWEWDNLPKKAEPPYFVFVGRYATYKGIDVSIEALAEVKKIHSDAKLVVVGKKNMEYINSSLKPLCDRLGLTVNSDADDNNSDVDVFLTGFVTDEEKLEYQSKATALVFPSIREGWGLIITEAATVGTPSIVFDSPGSVDAVNKGKAGFLCASNDVLGVASLMRSCLEDTVTYASMRRSAYDFAVKYLEWGEGRDSLAEVIKVVKNGGNSDEVSKPEE